MPLQSSLLPNVAPLKMRTRSATTRLTSETLDTQSSNIPGMQHALLAMMQPENITQGDTQVLLPLKRLPPPPPSTDATESPSRMEAPELVDLRHNIPSAAKANLLPAKATQLRFDQQRLRKNALSIAMRSGTHVKRDGNIIICQCEHAEEEGDMVECATCNTWQHLHCYGYDGIQDRRLRNEHTCYACLSGSDLQSLAILRDLAKRRRAVYAFLQGPKTQKMFVQYMGTINLPFALQEMDC